MREISEARPAREALVSTDTGYHIVGRGTIPTFCPVVFQLLNESSNRFRLIEKFIFIARRLSTDTRFHGMVSSRMVASWSLTLHCKANRNETLF